MARLFFLNIRGQKLNLRTAARRYKINPSTLARRLRDDWTVEEALGIVSRKRQGSPASKPVQYLGKKYPSIEKLAEELKLKASTLAARLRRRKAPLLALTEKHIDSRRQVNNGKKVQFGKKNYPSKAALLKEYGISRAAFDHRIARGWSVREALGIEARESNGKRFWREVEIIKGSRVPKTRLGNYKLYEITNNANGKIYIGITISEITERFYGHVAAAKRGDQSPLYRAIRKYGSNNFSIQIIRNDARNYLELQQQEVDAIEKRKACIIGYNVAIGGSIGTAKKIKVGRLLFPSYASAAQHYGIDPRVFALRISRLKWSPEEAAEIKLREKGARHRIIVRGKKYQSLAAAAAAFGLDYKVVYRRFKLSNWTIEQSLGLCPAPTKTAIAVQNVWFSSLLALENLHFHTLRSDIG